MGKLLAVHSGHVEAVLRIPPDRETDVGRPVGQLDQRGVRRGADARVILLPRPFGPGTPLVVRQRINDFSGQESLPLVQPQGQGPLPRVIVRLPRILDAVVEPRPEHQRQHVFLPPADLPAIAGHPFGHPVQMKGIRQPAAIQLVDRSVQLVGRPADALQDVRLGLQNLGKIHSRFHILQHIAPAK